MRILQQHMYDDHEITIVEKKTDLLDKLTEGAINLDSIKRFLY